ncbi:MAG: electron transport complex subunit RsxA [Lachnospirales bacterium]
MMDLVLLFLGAALVNNFIFSRFLGICPFLGVSKKVETAVGMGLAVTFVMALSSAVTYIVYHQLLVRFNLEYLYNIAFILIIASLVQLVEMFIKKSSPALYQALGIFLPLITTNCAVLGVTVLNKDEGYNFIESVINGTGAAIGFTIAIVLFAGIRERIARNNIPKSFEGMPIALITAGIMAVAFLGFSGLL